MKTQPSHSYLTLFRAIFLILLIAFASGTSEAGTKARHLYLLAGTPTNHMPVTFPVNLYTVGPGKNLSLVREIVPQREGLFGVRYDFEGRLYVSFPHAAPTTVSIIHEDRPMFKDQVTFNPGGLTVLGGLFGAAAGEGRQSYALFPMVWHFEGPASESLVSVRGDAYPGKPRVIDGNWSEYRSFRYAGTMGGPENDPQPLGMIAGNQVCMQTGAKPTEVATLPPHFHDEQGRRVGLFVASQRFFIFSILHGKGDRHAPTVMHVEDRDSGQWKVIRFPFSAAFSRICGPWLATIVGSWHPENRNDPGRENERDKGTLLLPNVRDLYSTFRGERFRIPGVLILDNLTDGRRITLKTNEEDSEILDVRKDGLVLYRVNDEIFSARIEGDKLSAPKLVVKGEDVPEVHWAFWSNAGPKPHSLATGASHQKQPFTVTLAAPNKPLKTGAKLHLRVTVKNISDRDITFVRSTNERMRYEIHVVDPKEQPAPPSPQIIALRHSKLPADTFFEEHARTLKPGESFVDEISITGYYDLGQPGVYTIWVRRSMPPSVASHRVEWPKGHVRSNTVTVTVVK